MQRGKKILAIAAGFAAALAAEPVEAMSCEPGPFTVHFELNSSELSAPSAAFLDQVIATFMLRGICRWRRIGLAGYADSSEQPDDFLLAGQRVAAVRSYLQNALAEPIAMVIINYGSTQMPMDQGTPPRFGSSRVEIVGLPLEDTFSPEGGENTR